jgi:hypothetical protein
MFELKYKNSNIKSDNRKLFKFKIFFFKNVQFTVSNLNELIMLFFFHLIDMMYQNI